MTLEKIYRHVLTHLTQEINWAHVFEVKHNNTSIVDMRC